jgi:hypothetical protein
MTDITNRWPNKLRGADSRYGHSFRLIMGFIVGHLVDVGRSRFAAAVAHAGR